MLQQEGADLITGTLTDPSFTHAVERLEVNLLGDLRRDELHGRALHRLGDRLGIALTLYLVGFMVIGAEWFAMWQSQRWDGRQPAFRILVCVGIIILIVLQDDNKRVGQRD